MFVLGRDLSLLQWLVHLLGGLVGLALMVDCHLCLALVGWGYNLTLHRVVLRDKRLILVGIEHQVHRGCCSVLQRVVVEFHRIAFTVVLLLLFSQGNALPFGQVLDAAILVGPVHLGFLVLFLHLFLLAATAWDKRNVLAVGVHLEVHGELLSVLALKELVLHDATLLEKFHLFGSELHVTHILTEMQLAHGIVYQFVGLLVVRHEAILHGVVFHVEQRNNLAEVASLFQCLGILFGEGVAHVLRILQLLLLAHEVRQYAVGAVRQSRQLKTCSGFYLLVVDEHCYIEKAGLAKVQHVVLRSRSFQYHFRDAELLFNLVPVNLGLVNGLIALILVLYHNS